MKPRCIDVILQASGVRGERAGQRLRRRWRGGFPTSTRTGSTGSGYHLSPEGLILLDGALAHVVCEREATYPAGDHTIVLGRVVGGTTHDGRPLLYYRGGYAALG